MAGRRVAVPDSTPEPAPLSDHPTVTFATLLEHVYSLRYNGLLVLHMHNGRVRKAEMGRPVVLYVDDGPPRESIEDPATSPA